MNSDESVHDSRSIFLDQLGAGCDEPLGRFGLVGGNIMQGEMTPDQSFSLRPIFGYADYTTPIEGLHLCGAGTHPGGGVMGVPGRNCAGVVTRALRRERRRVPLARLRGRRRTGSST